MTWANTSLESLGVDTSQVHIWTLRGTGDTITMSVVPESSNYALLSEVSSRASGLQKTVMLFNRIEWLN